MTKTLKTGIAMTLSIASLIVAACSSDTDRAGNKPVGDCQTSPVPNVDCTCFMALVENPEYSNIGSKLDEVALLTQTELAAGDVSFEQSDIDELMALTQELETSCLTRSAP